MVDDYEQDQGNVIFNRTIIFNVLMHVCMHDVMWVTQHACAWERPAQFLRGSVIIVAKAKLIQLAYSARHPEHITFWGLYPKQAEAEGCVFPVLRWST